MANVGGKQLFRPEPVEEFAEVEISRKRKPRAGLGFRQTTLEKMPSFLLRKRNLPFWQALKVLGTLVLRGF